MITAIVAVIAVVGYAMVQAPEPPGKIPPPASVSAEPGVSNFIASGGLVPDGAPTVPEAADALGHASVEHAESTEVATF
ncbi:MAG: hypothetical protein ABI887_09280 [Burkholderiales bacterium]